MDKKTACDMLSLPAHATRGEAKKAFRMLVKSFHPDRFAGDPKACARAEARMKEINVAFAFLLPLLPEEPEKRRPDPQPQPSSQKTRGPKNRGLFAALKKRFSPGPPKGSPRAKSSAVKEPRKTARRRPAKQNQSFDAVLRGVKSGDSTGFVQPMGVKEGRAPGYAAYSRYVRLKRQIDRQKKKSQMQSGRVEGISPVMPVRSVDGSGD